MTVYGKHAVRINLTIYYKATFILLYDFKICTAFFHSFSRQRNFNLVTLSFVEKITNGIERIFEDVEDDFAEVGTVRVKFEEWRQKYGETYTDAYIGLCLPKMFNPFVRLHLIKWNPLEVRDQHDSLVIFYHQNMPHKHLGNKLERKELKEHNNELKIQL